jgi:DNA-binding SARP family transcriptional activator
VLTLKLFGPGLASYGDRRLSGFPDQTPCLLLCYLVLNRNLPHHRDRLAAVFWPDRPSHIARKCLRHVLWRLRQTMEAAGARPEQYLSIEEEAITFFPVAAYQLDVELFQIAMSSVHGISGKHLTTDQAGNLERAVHLYAGDLLENADEDWCLHDREHLRLMYMNALEKLLLYYAAHEHYQRSLIYGEQILAHDSTRETIHQHIMWLHWVMGNRCAAAAQYKFFAQLLREEMNITPMPQTQHLYHLIQQGDPSLINWLTFREQMPALLQSETAGLPPALVSDLLQRIHHLQTVVAQSNSELNALEALVNKLLTHSRQI